MYTEFIETGSLYAYARICALRLDPTAQKEIRNYATKVDGEMAKAFPYAWAALRVQFTPAVPAIATAPAVEEKKNIIVPVLNYIA
jgi:thymidylate synthase ThyX